MKFGQVENPFEINFSLPQDHPRTKDILSFNKDNSPLNIYIGCAKWNKTDLKGFYPKGIKDELKYYASQFNAVEMNSTFYGIPNDQQILNWKEKVNPDFKFFPKIPSTISHYKRLVDVSDLVTQYISSISNFSGNLGMVFLQMHEYFSPKDYLVLEKFVKDWPNEIPLGIELRNNEWFYNNLIFGKLCNLLEGKKITNIIVDTAGRRDLLHMRLTNSTAFVRYVGANTDSDYTRLDDWSERIKTWKEEGLKNLYFFVHQNIEEASPLLASYFIKNLNKELGTTLKIPKTITTIPTLFDF